MAQLQSLGQNTEARPRAALGGSEYTVGTRSAI
jgi:hypothetical protein